MKEKDEEFKGWTAVLTGAASGMGFAAAKELARRGANVVMCDINAAALETKAAEVNAAGGGRAYVCVADVRKFADAERAAELALEKTGRIDLLVPFAGGYEPRMCDSYVPFYEQPIEVIDWGVQVNLMGPVYFARACLPVMVKQGHGVICLVGSTDGFENDGSGPMYGTSKSGLFSFTKGLAQAGAPHGVRAFCVAPGGVLTRPNMANMACLQHRAADPMEIVDLILYLASSKGRYVTGSVHVIDGGRLCMKASGGKLPDVAPSVPQQG